MQVNSVSASQPWSSTVRTLLRQSFQSESLATKLRLKFDEPHAKQTQQQIKAELELMFWRIFCDQSTINQISVQNQPFYDSLHSEDVQTVITACQNYACSIITSLWTNALQIVEQILDRVTKNLDSMFKFQSFQKLNFGSVDLIDLTKELGVFLGNIAKSCSEIKMGLDLLILKKCKNLEAEENNFMDIESSYSRVLVFEGPLRNPIIRQKAQSYMKEGKSNNIAKVLDYLMSPEEANAEKNGRAEQKDYKPMIEGKQKKKNKKQREKAKEKIRKEKEEKISMNRNILKQQIHRIRRLSNSQTTLKYVKKAENNVMLMKNGWLNLREIERPNN